jgi:subtilase family serine protease
VRRRPDTPSVDLNTLTALPRGQRQPLSRDTFAAQYGAAQTDIDQITIFAQTQGLKVVETSLARRTVVLSGTVEQMSQTFAVDFSRYQGPNDVYRGFEGSVYVPANLADVIEGVYGLDNRQIAQPGARTTGGPPSATSSLSTHPLTPPQVAQLYQFPRVSAANMSAAKPLTTIGILEFGGGFLATDIQDYFTKIVGLPVPAITVVSVDGIVNSPSVNSSPGNPGNYDAEVILDICVAASVAPGAEIVVYFAPNTEQGWIDAITKAVNDTTNQPSVLSISWTDAENYWGGFVPSISGALQEAAAVGVTIFASSGDWGSSTYYLPTYTDVYYPASDPWVTACGGTTIGNVSGDYAKQVGPFWELGTVPLSFDEVGWSGSGGGISDDFPPPVWQTWAGLPPSVVSGTPPVGLPPAGHSGRGVPDIAGNADPDSGYVLIYQGVQTPGSWGGTSAVAPLYAGLVALLNAQFGEPLGYLNYNLYSFAGSYAFRDILTGSNGDYQATPGWDAVTGLGSVVGDGFEQMLRGIGLPPAMAYHPSSYLLFMAWKGMERDESIYYSTLNGTGPWTTQQLGPNIGTSSGVALAEANGFMYMAWKGPLGDQSIYWSVFDGASWAQPLPVPNVGTSNGPQLAAWNGVLYMAWKGIEGDESLYWSTFNGVSWAPQQPVAGSSSAVGSVRSSVGPALAVFNGVHYAAWKGMSYDNSIYYSVFDNSVPWVPQHISGATTFCGGPSLTVFNGKLYAAWTAVGNELFWSNFDGTTWSRQQVMIPNEETAWALPLADGPRLS